MFDKRDARLFSFFSEVDCWPHTWLLPSTNFSPAQESQELPTASGGKSSTSSRQDSTVPTLM